MPVFEPSVDTTKNQERLAGVLVPILVMLGGIGLSYGIYTALRWSSFFRRRGFCNTMRSNTEAGATAVTTNTEKPPSIARARGQQGTRYLCLGSSPKLAPRSTCSQLFHPHQPTTTNSLGGEAILARKAMKIQTNISTAKTSKRVSLDSGKGATQPHAVDLEVSERGSAKGKENKNPHLPRQADPLRNGYKLLVLGTVPIIAPQIPERVVHPTHGYYYF
ncbi:hypothetical protein AX15_007938 [Amanita polypyramis BW_CC]|nr:hypothetical protein AX15_007938 [Amanita polypyramis BW_CC]